MSIDKVKEYFKTWGIQDRIQEFDCSSATVELAAQAIGCDKNRIAKTLSFLIQDKPILIVTSGDMKIDNQKYKEEFHTKAVMIPREQTEEFVGHAAGGICPFAIKDGSTVYLDQSLKRFENVYPACGSSNSVIKLTILELEQYSGCQKWIDVCKIIQ